MSNRTFMSSAFVLLIFIFMVEWLQLRHTSDSLTTSTNEQLLSGLRNERNRFAELISKGCTASKISNYSELNQNVQSSQKRKSTSPLQVVDGKLNSPQELAELMDSSVVLVLSNNSYGSGFFIAPNLIVTNSHVLENNQSSIWITNKALNKLIKAEIIIRTQPSHVGEADFAILHIAENVSATPLPIINDVARLSPVIAAGFPGIVVRTDPRLNRLINGETSQAPETVLTPGEVSTTQPQPNGIRLVIHTADISPGNSGGPLIDRCGRVVGINTFVSRNTEYASRVLYALSSANLAEFLHANGVNFTPATGFCKVGE